MTQTRVFGIILVTIGSYAILEEKTQDGKTVYKLR